MKIFYCVILYSLISITYSSNKTNKALSVFTVVRFPNEVCQSSTTGRNGTCYTASECTSRGGSSSGSCASSFGVCCVFEKSCGAGNIAENCTYFTSSSRAAGSSCSLTICKAGSDVCQLRLDFETFALTNPTTRLGIAAPAAAIVGTYSAINWGNCETDFFSVTVPGGKAPPLICGENGGQHIYVPASDECNVLSSFFGTGTTTTTSAFTIKVTQVKCNSKKQAPENCLQYLTAATGTFETFNYQNNAGNHLANQDYCTCIRSDRSACTVCYATVDNTNTGNKDSLGLGGAKVASGIEYVDTWCGFIPGVIVGGAAIATKKSISNAHGDYITIPNSQCAVFTQQPAGSGDNYFSVDRYCGTILNCMENALSSKYVAAITTGTAHVPVGTVCSSTKPFQVCVHTDATESIGANGAVLGEIQVDGAGTGIEAANVGYRGFRMAYWQVSTCLLRN